MAVLSEIRKRSWILIVIVALGLLAFLIDPNTIFSNLNQVDPNVYGEVDGQVITREEYNAAQQLVNQESQGRIPQEYIANQAWQRAVQNKLVNIHAEDAGIEVNESVIYAYQPEFKSAVDQLRERAQSGDQQAQQQLQNLPGIMKAQEIALRNQLYTSLMSTAMLTNKLEIKHAKENFNNLGVNYVKVDYENYNTKNPTEVSDEELKSYVNEHKAIFKREASRGLQYTYFPSAPSTSDEKTFNNNINAYLNGGVEYSVETGEVLDSIQSFASVKNDSAYVNLHSNRPYNPNYVSAQQVGQTLDPAAAKWVTSASVGGIYGPVKKGNNGILSKLVGVKTIDSVRVRHILVSYSGAQNSNSNMSKEQAQQLANVTLEKVKSNPSSFASEAAAVSQDPGSKDKGGEIGWVTEQSGYVPEFKNYSLSNPVGSFGVVESAFGFHIMNIEEKKQGKSYKLATIYKENRASEKTKDSLFNIANKYFADIKNGSLQEMVDIAQRNKYTTNEAKDVTRFQAALQGIPANHSEAVIKWAFEDASKVGKSNIFSTADGSYIVARVTATTPKGLATPEQLKGSPVETIVRNKKIAKKLIPELKGKDISAIASEYSSKVESDSLNFNQYGTQKLGMEPKVVGTAYGIAQGTQSEPIEGNSGIFVVKSVGTVPATINPTDEQIEMTLKQQMNGHTNNIMQTMMQDAEIEDQRSKIFN